jgi:Flp pilus assembly protein TadG
MIAQLRRLLRDKRGNVALMFAASLFPLAFLVGMAIDYTMASDRQAQLNGFADAATLAAVTPNMMAQSDTAAKTTATTTFDAQAQQLTSINYSPSNLTVNLSTTSGKRAATVTYTASSPTFFSALLGQNQFNLGGRSTATGGLPPNINFYLMLDSSPSMALAASSTGMQQLITATKNANGGSGCAFACYEYQPSVDNSSGKDNYSIARGLGLTLRIDLVTTATKNLTTTATMPDPGSGTTAKGDTPQEVLFIVTDGVEDACETLAMNPTTFTNCREQYYMNYINGSGNTYATPGGLDRCQTIKNRGIRIAVLYTT